MSIDMIRIPPGIPFAAASGATDLATLRRGYHQERAATGRMYLPWAIRHLDTAAGLIRQVLHADQILRRD